MKDGCITYTSSPGLGVPVALMISTVRAKLPPRLVGYIVAVVGNRDAATAELRTLTGDLIHVPIKFIDRIEPVNPATEPKEKKPPATTLPPAPAPWPPPRKPPPPPTFDPHQHSLRPPGDRWDSVPAHPMSFDAAWAHMDIPHRAATIRRDPPADWGKMTPEEQWHWLHGPQVPQGITWDEWRKTWKASYMIPTETTLGARKPTEWREYPSPFGPPC